METQPSSAKQAVEKLDEILALAKKLRRDPDFLLDTPSRVLWSFFVDTISDFEEREQRQPAKIHLTRVQQWMLEAFLAKHVYPRDHQRASLDRHPVLLGIPLVLNAERFRLE